MDPINRLDHVLQLIGRQMSERAMRLDSGAKLSGPDGPARAKRRLPLAALKRKVQERLASIDPDDARRADKARRVFLESVLAWQFGDALLLDRGFDEMVAGVQEALAAHAKIDARLDQLLRDLLAQSATR
jgi:hypothetical protein